MKGLILKSFISGVVFAVLVILVTFPAQYFWNVSVRHSWNVSWFEMFMVISIIASAAKIGSFTLGDD